MDKRRNDWIRRIAEGLEELQQRFDGFDPARLAENEAFISTAYQATQAVMRTHHEDKRQALRTAVLNAAVRRDLDEDLEQTFVRLIDTLTPWHLRLLRLFQDPTAATLNIPKVVYTVAAGDTFQTIAEKHGYSGEWRALLEANPDVDLVDGQPRPGTVLETPWPTLGASGNWTTSVANVIETVFPELKNRRERYEQIARELHAYGLFAEDSITVLMTSTGALQKRTTPLRDSFLRFISAPQPTENKQ